jgi:hypothetical protein
MKLINKMMAVVFVFCSLTNFAIAASSSKLVWNDSKVLTSNPVIIKNWSSLQQDLIGKYGGKVVTANTPQDLQALGDSKKPSAYVASVGNIEMFAILNQSVSNAVQKKILSIFKDVKSSDFKKYNDSMSVIATKAAANQYSVQVMLTGSGKQSQANEVETSTESLSFALNNSLTLRLPEGVKMLTEIKGTEGDVSAESYHLSTSLSGADFKGQLMSKLSKSGISYKEKKYVPTMTTIAMNGDGFIANLSFDQTSVASEHNLIALTISHY